MVSAIIITYKRPLDVLLRAVRSAADQTYKDMEIIVVNDYPENRELNEEIRAGLEALDDDRITFISHEHNMGACQARNTGIISSKGEYIALLDDDDEWLPEKTELQLKGFTSDRVGMVYSPFYNIGKHETRVLKDEGYSGNILNKLLYTNCIGGCSMPIMRRDVFDVCGLFDIDFPAMQDYDMWLRIAARYEIGYVPEPLTKRYVMDESITSNASGRQKGFEKFMKKHKALYENNPDAMNYRYSYRARSCFKRGNFKTGIQMLIDAIKIKPVSKYNILEPMLGIGAFLKSKVH